MRWLARGVCLCAGAARPSIRRLIARGVLRLVKHSRAGHLVHVLLPSEIPGAIPRANPDPRNFEATDFLRNHRLRKAIHTREGGFCFYCLRRLSARVKCIDHVVPVAKSGTNSYRNLVSCCVDCNSQKGEKPAADLLRRLYRDHCLSGPEFAARLRAFDDLAAGKLRPHLPDATNSLPPRARLRLHPHHKSCHSESIR